MARGLMAKMRCVVVTWLGLGCVFYVNSVDDELMEKYDFPEPADQYDDPGSPIPVSPRARKLASSTSLQCRSSLYEMVMSDPNWAFQNVSFIRWCRVIVENEMSKCCDVADFMRGRGEGCSDCIAECIHTPYKKFCKQYFGKACKLIRMPFHRTGAKPVVLLETFCVPHDCNNMADLNALPGWYHTEYYAQRVGWHQDYDNAILDCPGEEGAIIMYTLLIVAVGVCFIPILWFLCKAPKIRGVTLVSAEDMKDDDESEDGGGDE